MWQDFFKSLLPSGRGRVSPEDCGLSDEVRARVDDYLHEAGESDVVWNVEPKSFENGQALFALERDQLVGVVLYATARLLAANKRLQRMQGFSSSDRDWRDAMALRPLVSGVLRKKLPFDEARLQMLLESAGSTNYLVSSAGYVRQLEAYVEEHGLSDSLRPTVESFLRSLRRQAHDSQGRKLVQRVENLLNPPEAGEPAIDLNTGEIWTQTLQRVLDDCDPAAKTHWLSLLEHCRKATSSKPSKKWQKEAHAIIAEIGPEDVSAALRDVIADVGKPGREPGRSYTWRAVHPTMVHEVHSDLLRGLVWCSAFFEEDESLVQTVGSAAEICFHKLRDIGPRSPKIGNACLWALSNIPTVTAVGQLSRLKTRVKHASVRKQLAKALLASAENLGMTQDDLEEIAVPTFGLRDVGFLRQDFGEFTAILQADGVGKPHTAWLKPDGKQQKTVPKAVKEQHPDELKSLKKTANEIEKMLPALRERIEGLFLRERSWSWGDFRERYLDHPLAGIFARRLIWRFENDGQTRAGLWHDGSIIGCEGAEPSPETRVSIWHPLQATPEDVASWRECLHDFQIRQPFKQAHREIYRLTDAERQAGTYSNRFAGHILKQHQFAALCRQRGWEYSLQGAWDSHNTPTLTLPQWDLRVEFRADPAAEGMLSDYGIFLYVETDQVRFARLKDGTPVSLEEIPPLVFSEVMRDVDLFVGVCSVANDTDWRDGGPDGRFLNYWQSQSLGDLSATAQTRRLVLERLIPLSPIAERCSFEERFLVVRGDLRTYKIHLGSGNVLMSPNDEFLSIVPGRANARQAADAFLPFEGDQTLTAILAKAAMLADDTKIKDKEIAGQIRPR